MERRRKGGARWPVRVLLVGLLRGGGDGGVGLREGEGDIVVVVVVVVVDCGLVLRKIGI